MDFLHEKKHAITFLSDWTCNFHLLHDKTGWNCHNLNHVCEGNISKTQKCIGLLTMAISVIGILNLSDLKVPLFYVQPVSMINY